MLRFSSSLSIDIYSNLISSSAFVGLVVMLSLFPIPVYIGKLMSDVQRKKMQAVRGSVCHLLSNSD